MLPQMDTRTVGTTKSKRSGLLSKTTAILLAGLALVLVIVVALVFLVSLIFSGTPDASDVVQNLQDEGMPIGDTRTYSAENDPNELLGRPGQYIGKTTFIDTRLEQDELAGKFDVQNGGSVEIFETEDDAIERAEYLEAVTQSFGPFNEYAYREGNVLIRLSHSLTPQQAEEYEAALQNAS